MHESPKNRFLKLPQSSAQHREIVVSPQFVGWMDTALLQMLHEMPSRSPDLGTASANELRLEGARQFKDIFMRLSEPETRKQAPVGDHLPHV